MAAIANDMYERRTFIEASHPASFIRRLGRLDVVMVCVVLMVNLVTVWLISRRLPTYKDPNCDASDADDTGTCCSSTDATKEHVKQN